MKYLLFIIFMTSINDHIHCQITDNNSFKSYLSGESELLDSIMNNDKYRVQIKYTEIKEQVGVIPIKTTYDFGSNKYFYPASMVKLPLSILLMEKLKNKGISINNYLVISYIDPCSKNKVLINNQLLNITIGQMIEEMLVVSDDSYFTYFFYFLSPSEIKKSLRQKSINSTQIVHSFSRCMNLNGVEINFEIVDENGIRQLSEYVKINPVDKTNKKDLAKLIGSQQIRNGKIIDEPYDFSNMNSMSLEDIENTLYDLLYLDSTQFNKKWNLNYNQRKFLKKCLKKVPRDLSNKQYSDSNQFPDNYHKFSDLGYSIIPKDVLIYSKIGISYGFVTESSFFEVIENGVKFGLTYSIYVNKNNVINDSYYEYEKTARLFATELSKTLYKYNLLKTNN